jgi:hypothetical protein
MLPEVHTNATTRTEVRPPVEQEQQPGGTAPPTPPVGAMEAREVSREAPPVVSPPTPPRGGLTASIQRIPPAGRWALGLVFAFLSGVAFMFGPYTTNYGPGVFIVAIAAMFVLALAAGFVVTRWWAALVLVVAGAAGGVAGTALFLAMNANAAGGGFKGISDLISASGWFAILGLGPVIALLFAGVGLGKEQGLTLGQPHALTATEMQVGRWIAAIAPLVAAGGLAPNFAYIQGDTMSILTGSIYAVVLAATCLLAGWLLRSWWGFVLAPVVYAGVTAFAMMMQGGGGFPVGFYLYILLPAVLMSAIGTAIGMARARRSEQTQTA